MLLIISYDCYLLRIKRFMKLKKKKTKKTEMLIF